ncbi:MULTISPECIES: universal stress protein [Bacteria]
MISDTFVPARRMSPEERTDPLLGPGGRYIVGVDGSASSRAALTWAAARTLPDGAISLVGIADDDAGSVGAEYGDDVARRLAHVLSDAADDLLNRYPTARITTTVERGMVADTLARAADQRDVVVIGSDKTGYARGRMFGLRAVQLAAAVRGTMTVVPSIDLRLCTGVAVAVADLQNAPALAQRGAQEAARRGCSLAIVHAVSSGGQLRSAYRDDVLAAARTAALDTDSNLDVWAHVAQRHPSDAILNLSRDKALLVVGRSRQTSALGVGQTLHEVLMNANAPTVVVS